MPTAAWSTSAASTAEGGGAGPAATIVVGLGNPLLADDGAGWLVADEVEAALERLGRADVMVDRLAVGGLTLMERLVGFRRAIIVDALAGAGESAGSVRLLSLDAIPGREASHLDSSHDVSLAGALEAGRALGADLPEAIEVVTIAAERVLDLGAPMTPAVEAAIPVAARLVLMRLVS